MTYGVGRDTMREEPPRFQEEDRGDGHLEV